MANEISPQNKLKQLISGLSVHYDLTGEDIADVLWLALKQKEYSLVSGKKNQERLEPSQVAIFLFSNLFSLLINSELHRLALLLLPKPPIAPIKPSQVAIFLFSLLINSELHRLALLLLLPKPSIPSREPSVPIHPPQPSSSTGEKTIPLRHPDPPSLQQPLEFARTLRPLMRRVDSGRRTILDEIETVERTAEEGICIPILKSESEPWLDLALVVDENSSMIIWRNTVKELKQLLEHYGIFREVRTWGLTTDKYGDITLRVKVGQKESFKNPQELIDPTHRRLILIVSDCVAPIWFDGTILSTLEDWTKHQPMAIVQMLPDSMWLRTGLRLGASVKLVNLIPGAANRNLRIHELLLWKDINLKRGTKIPILTLNPEITRLWSDLVVGKYDRVMAGFVIPSALDFRPPPQLPQSQVRELNAEQRVKRFRKISSPLGRKLAGLLMAAPVITLPVVRLIQKTLLPQSQPVYVAEVFLGGLLKPLTKITTDINPDGVLFDVMHNGIRDILLDDAPFSDSVIIFEMISDYIESQLGKSLRECVGLLKKSSENGEGEEETVAKAYAKISLKVLKGLGGSYKDFAEELETSSVITPKPPKHVSPFVIIGTEPKTLAFEITTLEEIIEPLSKITFKIVTIVPKEQIKYRLSSTEIDLIEQHNLDLNRYQSRYQSYEKLRNSVQEGRDYLIDSHQGITDAVIIAPHGGKIEPGATEITKAIAGEEHSYYSLEGLKPGNNHDLSIPSEKFDEPSALKMVRQANRVIAIHIFFSGQQEELVHIGGLDTDLKQKIKDNLEEKGFSTQESGANFESENPQNICNRGKRKKGVNIGIARALLQKLLNGLKSKNTNEPTLYHRFIQAIRDALSSLEAAGWRYQTTQGEADYYTEVLEESVGIEMVSIPGGSFIMGSPENEGYDQEKPQHQVNVPDFFMGRYPITQEQWKVVAGWERVERELELEPSYFQEEYEGIDRGQRPVERISWEDAKEFCVRLSKKTNKEYRLPTEAEWEYACRAGTTTPFHFGETISTELANYYGKEVYGKGVEGEYRGQTTPVGYFKVANAFGLSDMHGNVWEWCEDDYHEDYEDAPSDRSAWLSEDRSNSKMLRGGAWDFLPGLCRSAFRFNSTRVNRDGNVGFRVVCVVSRNT